MDKNKSTFSWLAFSAFSWRRVASLFQVVRCSKRIAVIQARGGARRQFGVGAALPVLLPARPVKRQPSRHDADGAAQWTTFG